MASYQPYGLAIVRLPSQMGTRKFNQLERLSWPMMVRRVGLFPRDSNNPRGRGPGNLRECSAKKSRPHNSIHRFEGVVRTSPAARFLISSNKAQYGF